MTVGLPMDHHGVTCKQAFEALRNQARSQRRKIAEVADEAIHAAETLNAPLSKETSDE
jgi:AmiR/NasT family two-component response regulator